MENTRINVLLVEDTSSDVKIILASLAEADGAEFIVNSVVRQAEAREQVREKTFDAILLDLNLPDSRGLATLDAVLEMVPRTPVVVVTGVDDEKTALEAIQKGAQDYVTKNHLDSSLLAYSIRYAMLRQSLKSIDDDTREIRAMSGK